MSVSSVARALGLGWDTFNAPGLSLTRNLVFDRPGHLDWAQYLGAGERKWKYHRGQGDPDFVTVIVDRTPVIDDVEVSNGPVDAIIGRLEHLRGIAFGFRNLDHYILRSPIHSGQLRERINAL